MSRKKTTIGSLIQISSHPYNRADKFLSGTVVNSGREALMRYKMFFGRGISGFEGLCLEDQLVGKPSLSPLYM